MNWLIALVALASMEIVLGIDNIVFIAIVTGKLPVKEQPKARFLGLALAMVMRVLLLLTLKWIMGLDEPILILTDWLPASLFANLEHPEDVVGVSVKDLIVLAGGMFLIFKSVREVHEKLEHHESEAEVTSSTTFFGALLQIAILDIIFSLDSVITAVGMVDDIKVMVAAVILAVLVMMAFAGPVSDFVSRNPTIKMLALSFMILIGVMLVAEGVGTDIDKGYIYFAMVFAMFVEMLNIRVRRTELKSQRKEAATDLSS